MLYSNEEEEEEEKAQERKYKDKSINGSNRIPISAKNNKIENKKKIELLKMMSLDQLSK